MSDVTHLPRTKRAGGSEPPPPIPPGEHPAQAERFIPAHESHWRASAEFEAPRTWYCPVAGTPFEHLLRPEYWASLSINRLKAGTHIDIVAEDNSYWAWLYVDKVGQGYAQVLCFAFKDLVAMRGERAAAYGDPATKPEAYLIEHSGPIAKWRVIRTKDNQELKRQLDTQEEARKWLEDYKRMLAH